MEKKLFIFAIAVKAQDRSEAEEILSEYDAHSAVDGVMGDLTLLNHKNPKFDSLVTIDSADAGMDDTEDSEEEDDV